MAKDLNLKGLIPAVVVPMRENYSIDFPAFERYLDWMVGLGPVGLALNVDTGEGPYLTPDERVEVIRTAGRIAQGRCALIAGVGGPSTATATVNARTARDAGADALLVFPTAAFLLKRWIRNPLPVSQGTGGGCGAADCRVPAWPDLWRVELSRRGAGAGAGTAAGDRLEGCFLRCPTICGHARYRQTGEPSHHHADRK